MHLRLLFGKKQAECKKVNQNKNKLTAGAPLLRQLVNCATRDRPLRLFSLGRDFFPLLAEEGLAEGDW